MSAETADAERNCVLHGILDRAHVCVYREHERYCHSYQLAVKRDASTRARTMIWPLEIPLQKPSQGTRSWRYVSRTAGNSDRWSDQGAVKSCG
jgi:hypothetical protein